MRSFKAFFKVSRLPIIIHSDCQGADRICGIIATSLGFEVRSRPANWSLGKCAGPIRNSEMVEELVQLQSSGYHVYVLSFHDTLRASRGTKDCVSKALKRGLTVYSVSSTDIKPITEV